MPSCFVIMPITTPATVRETYRDKEHFAHVLEHLFTPALEGLGFDVVPPSAAGSDVIQGEIIRNLDEADLVLCDMTSLNANVFFELGIRTALDKPVATVRDGHTDAIPFDHSIVNCHTYDGNLEPWTLPDQVESLKGHIRACVTRGGEHNTLWKYFGVEASARVGSAGTDEDAKLDYLVRQVEDLRREVRVPGRAQAEPDPELIEMTTPQIHLERGLLPAMERFLLAAWKITSAQAAGFVARKDGTGAVVLDLGVYKLGRKAVRALVEAAVAHEIVLQVVADDPETDELFRKAGCALRPDARPGPVIAYDTSLYALPDP